MENERYWQSVEELLQKALSLDPAERLRFLADVSDPALRSEVESLLTALEGTPELDLERVVGEAANQFKAAKHASLIGRRIGRYEVLEHLGSGGMSEVFLGSDLTLGRTVALKLLPLKFRADRERVFRFQREARAASALNHPNILTIFDIGEEDGQLFIATEYVDGESLRARLDRQSLSVAESLRIAEQVASALATAHGAGILHRDITPSNVMIRPDGIVKLLDFGLARFEENRRDENATRAPWRTMEGAVLGTPAYMSPEQARGRPLDARSDLWSVGAVLHEMLTGRAPFRGESTPDVLVAVLERAPTPPSADNPDVPRGVDRLVLKLLEKDPEHRPASAARVRQELQLLRGDLESRAPQAPSGRGVWLRRAGWVAAAAVLAIIAISAWRRQEPQEPEATLRQITTTVPENRVTAAGISADGQRLVVAELGGALLLRQLETGEVHVLPAPPGLAIDQIAWFESGDRFLLAGLSSSTQRPSLWLLDLAAEAPEMLQEDARRGVPSPDGELIAFTRADASEIWIADADGGEARSIVVGGDADTFSVLLWSPDSRRLSYQRSRYSPNPDVLPADRTLEQSYRKGYESVDLSGRLLAQHDGVSMSVACALRDGRILFLQEERRADDFNLWEVPTDPQTGAFAANPRRLTSGPDRFIADLTCSADGKFVGILLQDSQSNIYIADIEQGGRALSGVRRATFEARSEYPHAWTADSQSLIFEMMVDAGWDLYRQRIDERVAQPLATGKESGITPQLSPDGEWVLYCAYEEGLPDARARQRLMRVPVSGGESQLVPTGGPFDEFRCALEPGKRCVLRTVENRQFIYSELDPVRGRGRELARTAWAPGILGDWALSWDGAEVAIPNHSNRDAIIRLLALDPPLSDPRIRELKIPGLTSLRGLRPQAGTRGWFASADSPSGVKLLHIDEQGRFDLLRESPVVTWGVPSPDGRRLAFVDQALMSNLWAVDF